MLQINQMRKKISANGSSYCFVMHILSTQIRHYWEIVWVQFILMIPQLTKDAHSSTTERYIWNDSTKFAVGLLSQIVLSTIVIRSVTRELARENIVVWMFKVNSELYYGTEINSWLQIECTLRSINLNYFSTNFFTWIN